MSQPSKYRMTAPGDLNAFWALFTDNLITRKSTVKDTSDILHLVNQPQLIILLKYYMENMGAYIHVGAGAGIEDIIIAKYIESK